MDTLCMDNSKIFLSTLVVKVASKGCQIKNYVDSPNEGLQSRLFIKIYERIFCWNVYVT